MITKGPEYEIDPLTLASVCYESTLCVAQDKKGSEKHQDPTRIIHRVMIFGQIQTGLNLPPVHK